MLSKTTLQQKGLLVIALPLFCQIVFIGGIGLAMMEEDKQVAAADETVDSFEAIDSLAQCHFKGAFSLVLYGIFRKTVFRDSYRALEHKIPEHYHRLEKIFNNDSHALKLVADVKKHGDEIIDIADTIMAELKGGDLTNLRIFDGNNQKQTKLFLTLTTVNERLSDLYETAQAMRDSGNKAFRGSHQRLLIFMVCGVLLNIVMSLFIAWLYRTNLVERLGRVAENCSRLTRHEPLKELLQGKDEIANLDLVFHKMAAELNAAAKKERSVVEEALDVICTIDPEGLILTINKSGTALFRADKSRLLGKSIYELVSETNVRQLTDILKNVDEITRFDFPMQSAEGTPLHTRWSVRRTADRHYYCVISDVSIERETEELKNYLVSMITHDLRTPLNSIQIMLTLLETGAYGELEPHEATTTLSAKNRCERLIQVISCYLDLEKINSGAFSALYQPTDLSSMLDGICENYDQEAADDQTVLKFSDSTRGCNVNTDSQLLETSLRDLVNILCLDGPVEILLRENQNAAVLSIQATLADHYRSALSLSLSELFGKGNENSEHFESMLRLSRIRALISLLKGSLTLSGNQRSSIEIALPLVTKESH